jgi:hypothetical protein
MFATELNASRVSTVLIYFPVDTAAQRVTFPQRQARHRSRWATLGSPHRSLAFGSDQVMPRALYPSSCPLLACSGTDRDRPCSTATPQALVRIEHAPAPSSPFRIFCRFPAPRVFSTADDEGVQCCQGPFRSPRWSDCASLRINSCTIATLIGTDIPQARIPPANSDIEAFGPVRLLWHCGVDRIYNPKHMIVAGVAIEDWAHIVMKCSVNISDLHSSDIKTISARYVVSG